MTPAEAYAIAFDVLSSRPQRYAAEKPMKLSLYAYVDGQEMPPVPLGEHDAWEAFAADAIEQGGELQRLCEMGHTDEFRPHDALVALGGQLERWKAPEKYGAIVGALREAVAAKGVEGILISSGEDE